MVKRLPTMWVTQVPSLGWEDPLEKEMATHSSTLAWKIPWMEEHGRLYSPWGRKELDTTERLHFSFLGYSWCLCVLSHLSRVWLCVTLWTVAHQAPLSMGFSRQEYLSGLPCPSPGDLPDPGIKPTSLMSPAWAGGFFTTSATIQCEKSKFCFSELLEFIFNIFDLQFIESVDTEYVHAKSLQSCLTLLHW